MELYFKKRQRGVPGTFPGERSVQIGLCQSELRDKRDGCIVRRANKRTAFLAAGGAIIAAIVAVSAERVDCNCVTRRYFRPAALVALFLVA
eukprot:IDg919t1